MLFNYFKPFLCSSLLYLQVSHTCPLKLAFPTPSNRVPFEQTFLSPSNHSFIYHHFISVFSLQFDWCAVFTFCVSQVHLQDGFCGSCEGLRPGDTSTAVSLSSIARDISHFLTHISQCFQIFLCVSRLSVSLFGGVTILLCHVYSMHILLQVSHKIYSTLRSD